MAGEVGALERRAGASGTRLPTLTIVTQIGFRSAADRAATAQGMSAWFLPTEMEERESGALHFTMGPEMGSDGQVTDWDPPRRIVFEEEWADLMGKDPMCPAR